MFGFFFLITELSLDYSWKILLSVYYLVTPHGILKSHQFVPFVQAKEIGPKGACIMPAVMGGGG